MSFRRTTGQEGLLLWLQAKTCNYPNVNVVDFTYSWENGLAFCALVHAHYPDKIPFSELKPENKEHNLKLAFDTAAEVGVPALMDPEDMLLECGPDRFSVVTYLSQFFHKFKDFDKDAPAGKDAEVRKPKETVDMDEEVRKRREALDKTLARPERKCSKCNGGLSHGTIIEALGKNFHTNCFVCASCDKPFPNNKFMNVDGKPYCAMCGKKAFSTNKNAGGSNAPAVAENNPKCAKCGEACGGDTIDAIGQSWHPKCFVCVTCSKQFANGKFLNVDSKPYCEQCGRKAFISTRVKPAAAPAPSVEPKPANPFQTPGSLSKSKSMFAVPTGARSPTPSDQPFTTSPQHPKVVPISGGSVSARLGAFQQKDENSTGTVLSPRAAGTSSGSTPDSQQEVSAADREKEFEERRIKKAEEDAKKKREMEEREAKRKEMEELERKQKEEQRLKREEDKKKKKQEEEDKKRKETEEKEAKKKEEEELKKKKSEEKRKQMEDLKKKKDEEELKKKQELEEEEAKKKEDKNQRAEAAKKKREEMKKLVEEEEAKKLAQKEAEKQQRKSQRVDIKSPDTTTTTLTMEPKSLGINTSKTAATAPSFTFAVNNTPRATTNDSKVETLTPKESTTGGRTCPAADVMCPWSGTEGGYQSHISTCHYVALRPVLSTLLKQNQEMLTAIQDLKQQFANLPR